MQELKFAVSIIIYRNNEEFLVTKRPETDNEFGSFWGLPASGFDPKKETPDQAAERVAREKLGCEVEILERIPLAFIQKRQGYDLLLIDYICRLKSGEPDVKKANTTGTVYTGQKWTKDPSILKPIAENGSICAQLFLNHKGLWPKEKFITKI